MRSTLLKLLARFTFLRGGEEGQDLIEYGLLCSLISLSLIASASGVSTSVNKMFSNVSNALLPSQSQSQLPTGGGQSSTTGAGQGSTTGAGQSSSGSGGPVDPGNGGQQGPVMEGTRPVTEGTMTTVAEGIMAAIPGEDISVSPLRRDGARQSIYPQ